MTSRAAPQDIPNVPTVTVNIRDASIISRESVSANMLIIHLDRLSIYAGIGRLSGVAECRPICSFKVIKCNTHYAFSQKNIHDLIVNKRNPVTEQSKQN